MFSKVEAYGLVDLLSRIGLCVKDWPHRAYTASLHCQARSILIGPFRSAGSRDLAVTNDGSTIAIFFVQTACLKKW